LAGWCKSLTLARLRQEQHGEERFKDPMVRVKE
jgi:hypothetical protein